MQQKRASSKKVCDGNTWIFFLTLRENNAISTHLVIQRLNSVSYLLLGVFFPGESVWPLGVLVPDDFALDEPALDLPADFSWDVGVLSVLVELGLDKKKSPLDWSKVTKHCTLFIIEKLLQFLTDASLFNFDIGSFKGKSDKPRRFWVLRLFFDVRWEKKPERNKLLTNLKTLVVKCWMFSSSCIPRSFPPLTIHTSFSSFSLFTV